MASYGRNAGEVPYSKQSDIKAVRLALKRSAEESGDQPAGKKAKAGGVYVSMLCGVCCPSLYILKLCNGCRTKHSLLR